MYLTNKLFDWFKKINPFDFVCVHWGLCVSLTGNNSWFLLGGTVQQGGAMIITVKSCKNMHSDILFGYPYGSSETKEKLDVTLDCYITTCNPLCYINQCVEI